MRKGWLAGMRDLPQARGGVSTGSVSSAPQVISPWVSNDTSDPRWLSEKGLLVLKPFGASINTGISSRASDRTLKRCRRKGRSPQLLCSQVIDPVFFLARKWEVIWRQPRNLSSSEFLPCSGCRMLDCCSRWPQGSSSFPKHIESIL